MKPAFSTVAVPEWTLSRIISRAGAWGFEGCELRTFGYGSTQFACDPALTSAEKVRDLFTRAGLRICSLATSARFDEPVTMLEHVLGSPEFGVPEANSAVELAVQIESPYVRVFGFEISGSESRSTTVARIAERLKKVCDHGAKSGVRVIIENGGSFSTAAQLAEIIDRTSSPFLGAAYSVPVAIRAGERPEDGANVLGERLVSVKLRDYKNGLPCLLGEGDFDHASAIRTLARIGFDGWIVYEYDRAWVSREDAASLPDSEEALTHASKAMREYIRSASTGLRRNERSAPASVPTPHAMR